MSDRDFYYVASLSFSVALAVLAFGYIYAVMQIDVSPTVDLSRRPPPHKVVQFPPPDTRQDLLKERYETCEEGIAQLGERCIREQSPAVCNLWLKAANHGCDYYTSDYGRVR